MLADVRQIIFVQGIVDIDRGITFVSLAGKRRRSQKGCSPARVVLTACPSGTQQAKERKACPYMRPAFFDMLARKTAENWVDYESPTAQEACR